MHFVIVLFKTFLMSQILFDLDKVFPFKHCPKDVGFNLPTMFQTCMYLNSLSSCLTLAISPRLVHNSFTHGKNTFKGSTQVSGHSLNLYFYMFERSQGNIIIWIVINFFGILHINCKVYMFKA